MAKKNNVGLRVFGFVSRMTMFGLAIVQLFDFIFTSIAIQDFLGTGKTFIWAAKESYAHVSKETSPSQTYCQDNEDYHYKDAFTKWGSMILKEMSVNSSDYLWASVGYFDSSKAPEMDMCNYFKGDYYHIHPTRNRFMTSKEKLTLVKPMSLEFHEDELSTLQLLDEKLSDGYVGSRRAVEVRMTARMDFPEWLDTITALGLNGTVFDMAKLHVRAKKIVKAVRFYGKSFCDGCQPIAELGQMFCELECDIEQGDNETDMHVVVLKSARRAHSKHRMGVSFPSSQASFVETAMRVGILLYIMHAVLNILINSCKSNEERYHIYKRQGATAAVLHSTLVKRSFWSEFLQPQQNIARATPFSLSFFMYNSDIVIFANCCVVLLTFIQSMQLKHEVVWWAEHDETFRAVITRIGVNAKILWLYLALIKLYKHIIVRFFKRTDWSIKISFHSHVFVWFWIVFMVFLTLVKMDFLLDPFFHDRIDIINNFELINDVSVRFQNGFYFVRIPWIILHSIFVSAFALSCLIGIHSVFKLGMPQNSLYRTLACCHSTLVWDPELFIEDDTKKAALVPIGTLMNLKWFLKTQCLVYPESGVYEGLATDYRANCQQEERAGIEDSVCRFEVTGDRVLHIIMKTTNGDLEHMAQFHQWLQHNRTLIVL